MRPAQTALKLQKQKRQDMTGSTWKEKDNQWCITQEKVKCRRGFCVISSG
jgi:hypothetical protein